MKERKREREERVRRNEWKRESEREREKRLRDGAGAKLHHSVEVLAREKSWTEWRRRERRYTEESR